MSEAPEMEPISTFFYQEWVDMFTDIEHLVVLCDFRAIEHQGDVWIYEVQNIYEIKLYKIGGGFGNTNCPTFDFEKYKTIATQLIEAGKFTMEED